MAKAKPRIVTGYVKMWPRAVFDMKEKNQHPVEVKDLLQASGVYVLYRDDLPHYVGKATRLWRRLRAHAIRPRDRYYHFWNYFSAFVVPDPQHVDEIEGLLIASMPTENSAVRKIKRVHLPAAIAKKLHALRSKGFVE
jgi:hypothetical protein